MTALPVTSAAPGNLAAIAAMMGSQAVFTVNDALMKLAARELPGGQAIFIRGLFTIALALALAMAMGGLRVWPSRKDWPLIGLRNIGEVGRRCST